MYAGKMLEVDLTRGKHEMSPLGEDLPRPIHRRQRPQPQALCGPL